MEWLTKKEVARRAKKSYKDALLVSIEHHQQIANATRKEFFAAVGLGKVSISSGYCGVCLQREEDCNACFLGKGTVSGCGGAWKKIHNAIGAILVADNASWLKVVEAEKDMIKVLRRELRKQ